MIRGLVTTYMAKILQVGCYQNTKIQLTNIEKKKIARQILRYSRDGRLFSLRHSCTLYPRYYQVAPPRPGQHHLLPDHQLWPANKSSRWAVFSMQPWLPDQLNKYRVLSRLTSPYCHPVQPWIHQSFILHPGEHNISRVRSPPPPTHTQYTHNINRTPEAWV